MCVCGSTTVWNTDWVASQVIVSEFNKLDGNRYYDVESSTSFEFDHVTQVCPDERILRGPLSLTFEDMRTNNFVHETDRICNSIRTPGVSKCRPNVRIYD